MKRTSSHRAAATGRWVGLGCFVPCPAGGKRCQDRSALRALLLAAACLSGCGDAAPATLDALRVAHLRTQPPYPGTLRLVHDIETTAGRWRVVASIRQRPFAYREDAVGTSPPRPPLAKVSDGRLAWRPRSGLPGIPLVGDEARSFLARTLVEGRLYLDPEIAGDRARLAGPGTLPAVEGLPPGLSGERDVLVVDQPTAAAVTLRLAFDARDHRLLGTSEPHLDRQAWTRFGDWQTRGALLLPGIRIDGRSNPDRRTLARLVAVELNPSLSAELFAGHPLDVAPARTVGGTLQIVSDAVPGVAWLLAADCAVNGQGIGPAQLDTGASRSAVDPTLARRLDLPAGGAWSGETFVDKVRQYKCWIDEIRVGEHSAWQVTALTGNFRLTPALPAARAPLALIGGEELTSGNPVFDLARGRMQFRRSPAAGLRETPGAGPVVEVQARQERPGVPCLYVTVRVRGRELLALFDTGFGGTLFLTGRGADKAGVARDPRAVRDPRAFGQEASGIGPGSRVDLVTPLPGFELGPLRYGEVWAQVQSDDGPGDAERSFEALVGCGALLPFPRVGIDAGRSILEFELPTGLRPDKEGTVAVPSLGMFSGAMFAATEADEPAVTSAVQPGSPAARAGLQIGDRLVSIGPDIVTSNDLVFALRRLWLQPGQPVSLNVIRAGRPLGVVLSVE